MICTKNFVKNFYFCYTVERAAVDHCCNKSLEVLKCSGRQSSDNSLHLSCRQFQNFLKTLRIINTLIKNKYECDLLVLDECHRYASELNQQVFTRVKYKYILGLSATMERLDGKHELLYKYCPIVDRINDAEAIANGWVAKSVEYKVILDVDDLDQYRVLSKEFNEHYEFFQYDFKLAMSMLGKDGFKRRAAYRDQICKANPNLDSKEVFKTVTFHSVALARVLQARKKFINSHPKKIELTKEIIKYRPNSKIITFYIFFFVFEI